MPWRPPGAQNEDHRERPTVHLISSPTYPDPPMIPNCRVPTLHSSNPYSHLISPTDPKLPFIGIYKPQFPLIPSPNLLFSLFFFSGLFVSADILLFSVRPRGCLRNLTSELSEASTDSQAVKDNRNEERYPRRTHLFRSDDTNPNSIIRPSLRLLFFFFSIFPPPAIRTRDIYDVYDVVYA